MIASMLLSSTVRFGRRIGALWATACVLSTCALSICVLSGCATTDQLGFVQPHSPRVATKYGPPTTREKVWVVNPACYGFHSTVWRDWPDHCRMEEFQNTETGEFPSGPSVDEFLPEAKGAAEQHGPDIIKKAPTPAPSPSNRPDQPGTEAVRMPIEHLETFATTPSSGPFLQAAHSALPASSSVPPSSDPEMAWQEPEVLFYGGSYRSPDAFGHGPVDF